MQIAKNQSIKREIIYLIPFFLFFVLLTYFVSDHIFFWDTIQLGAKHASFFYDTHFSSLLLPENMDSGHIPTFGAYLALNWLIFGKNLMVSHFAMLPFLLGIVWQSYTLLKKYISQKYVYFALTLFLADATLLSQSTLMSPDLPFLFVGFKFGTKPSKNLNICGTYGIISNKYARYDGGLGTVYN